MKSKINHYNNKPRRAGSRLKNKITMCANNIMRKIETANENLCKADNNLRYIKALKSCLFWLLKLDAIAQTSPDVANSGEYKQLFLSGCGWSFFERVNNSIEAYNYGERPF